MKPVEKMFSEKGSWFKGNLHSHTVNSDGRLTPAQSAAYYREHGYSFICFSEHDYYTDLRKIMRCDSDSGKKLIKSMVLRTADRQGMC